MPASNVAAEKRSQPQILVETAGLSEEKWLAYRRKGIGGSDVAALLGISPWRTARDLYFDKLNIVAVEDNEDNWVALEMGHLLEPLVAKIFQHRTKCLEDIAFARLTMHPRKSMIHCFQYISRKAWDYIQDELKASGIQPGPGSQGYGCDVPDDLCYQWAEDYFRDPDAKEDHKEEEKFVPNPYYGKDFARTTKKKQKEKKKAEAKPKPVQKEKPANDGQLSLLDLGMTKAG